MKSFLDLVQNFVVNSTASDCKDIDVSLLDEIIIHPELGTYLSNKALFEEFWDEWKKIDQSGHILIEPYNVFKRFLSRMDEKNFTSFSVDVVSCFIKILLEFLQNNEIEEIDERRTNYRLCINIIIQRHTKIDFLMGLYKNAWLLLSSQNIDEALEKEIQEILKNIVSRLLLLPNGHIHFYRLLKKLNVLTEQQHYALLSVMLLRLIYLPATKELDFFKLMLQHFPSIATSGTLRNIYTYILILRESLDLINSNNIQWQWNALMDIKSKLSTNPAIQEFATRGIDLLLNYLLPYLPAEVKRNFPSIPVDAVVSLFSQEIPSPQVVNDNFFPIWENLLDNNGAYLQSNSEINELLEIITKNSCPLTAKELLSRSFNSDIIFNVIWDKILQNLDLLLSQSDSKNADHEALFVQMLLSMSGRFKNTSSKRQANCEKLLYMLDTVAQEPSEDEEYNNDMIDSISLIIKNLLYTCSQKVVSDLWGQVLSKFFLNPVYFLPLMGELFSLIGLNEKMDFWNQLQFFFSSLKSNYSFPEEGLAVMERTLQSLQMMLPKIMKGTHDMITQQIIALNQTLRVALTWSFILGAKVEFFVHKVQLHAIVSLTHKEHREMLNKEWRDLLVHPEALNHPLCVLAAIALDRDEWPNTNGMNTLLNADVLWETLLPAHNKMSLHQYKPFLISSLFTLVEWSIYKLSFDGHSPFNETDFIKVINKIEKLITHPNRILQEVGVEVLQKLAELYNLLKMPSYGCSYSRIPTGPKDIIWSYLFNAGKYYSENENIQKNEFTLNRCKHFFNLLENKLTNSPHVNNYSVQQALALIDIKEVPLVTDKKNSSSQRSFLGKRTHPMITRSRSKIARTDLSDGGPDKSMSPR